MSLNNNTRLKRFYDNLYMITESGCWIWLSSVHKTGYGYFCRKMVHRWSYAYFKGIIPKNMFVCHSCDIRLCVNPNHLFLGTHQDNMNDMKKKGRSPNNKGENNSTSKLTEKEVIEIKKLLIEGIITKREIAKLYNVKKVTIKSIAQNRNWKHVIL